MSQSDQPAGVAVDRGVRPAAEALRQERDALRRLTYRTDAITARLEAIYRALEKAEWTQ